MTRNHILDNLFRSPIIDDMLFNITGGNDLRHDLKSELFIILMEMPEQKIITAWKNHWLNYLCVNILKKQWRSSTSPFYKKYRKDWGGESLFEVIEELDDFDYDTLDKVLKIVDGLPLVEKELFQMRYKLGKYDRWLGEWRDKTCEKPIYSYRKIENKLAIQTYNSNKPITIDHSTVEKYHKRVIEKIKKILIKYDKQ